MSIRTLKRLPSSLLLGLCLSLPSAHLFADNDILGQFLEQNMLTSSDPIEIFAESTIYPADTQAITGGLILSSQSALVVNNKTGQILYQKNADRIMPIASISKLMSAMVVLDANLDMNETVTITPDEIDRLKGTGSRLAIGTALTRKELLHLSLMSSENRATHALGRTYPGGMGAFVAAMNRKAQSLGMYGSRFYEPTGLNFQNVSTAKDLSLMVNAAAQYPQIRTNSTSNYASV
ncbi:serine hydrolase, partial [Neisseria gonorrhoeae]